MWLDIAGKENSELGAVPIYVKKAPRILGIVVCVAVGNLYS